ncbi:MAG: hypothetical protein MI923_04455 [Phycisphaerales bacterium]|nr:hypothetical protein [Phycisphaerales bacterium]
MTPNHVAAQVVVEQRPYLSIRNVTSLRANEKHQKARAHRTNFRVYLISTRHGQACLPETATRSKLDESEKAEARGIRQANRDSPQPLVLLLRSCLSIRPYAYSLTRRSDPGRDRVASDRHEG